MDGKEGVEPGSQFDDAGSVHHRYMHFRQGRACYKRRFDDQVLGMTGEGRALYIRVAAVRKFASRILVMGDQVVDEYFGRSAEGEEHQEQTGQ
jgi:hypothetical protein